MYCWSKKSINCSFYIDNPKNIFLENVWNHKTFFLQIPSILHSKLLLKSDRLHFFITAPKKRWMYRMNGQIYIGTINIMLPFQHPRLDVRKKVNNVISRSNFDLIRKKHLVVISKKKMFHETWIKPTCQSMDQSEAFSTEQ